MIQTIINEIRSCVITIPITPEDARSCGLEQVPDNQPIAHIFVSSKSPWYEITDNLPQYPEWPPEGANAVRASRNKD